MISLSIETSLNENIFKTKCRNDLTDPCFEVIIQLLSINRGLTELSLIENNFSNETNEPFKKIKEKYGVNVH